jgi:predicted RecB family endonuclease
MIRCDTEAERRALARLMWAVEAVLAGKKRSSWGRAVVELDGAFDALYRSDGSPALAARLPRLATARRKT